MREIKFRSLGVDGKWRFGSHYPNQGDLYSINLASFFANLHVGALLPGTCGQYTGLKDKQDKEIYEGDIVQSKVNECLWKYLISTVESLGNNLYAITRYRNFTIVNDKQVMGDFYVNEGASSIYDYSWTVIGNIYENPELLK